MAPFFFRGIFMNTSFVFSSVEKEPVIRARDQFFDALKDYEEYSVIEDEVIQVNGKWQARVLLAPMQMEIDFEEGK